MTARIGRAVWVVPGTTTDRHGSASQSRRAYSLAHGDVGVARAPCEVVELGGHHDGSD